MGGLFVDCQLRGIKMILNELKALSNEKRLKIIYALSINNFCQMHVIEISGLSQVDASRGLKILVDSGLVDSEKHGNRVLYSLSEKMIECYREQLTLICEEYKYLSYDIDTVLLIDECKSMV